MVEKAKEYIKNGEVYQVVLSRRFETEYKDSLLNAYRVLGQLILHHTWCLCKDDVQIISTSRNPG